MTTADIGVVVLAGGRSTRMGADKAQVRLNGVRLVDVLLTSLPEEMDYVVVSSQDLGIPTVSEDPPFGGPVAGIAAGAARLSNEFIAVLAVDAPASAGLVQSLYEALESSSSDVAAVVSDGMLQPLCALWRRTSLQEALNSLGSPRDKSAKKLIYSAETLAEVPGDGRETDYDTADELRRLGEVEL
ncbi:molybdenum cofactor guanylyltransferase [Corynebacterium lubricantis]|uniref:molybdenum cofactor guanylyltransferase n=1 Tax=Corynebacterium lubricantis TaxID=541095 RepID=UPI00037DAC25|nr:molybdenum cofactor guanylyltransferase [Corynebacterium lubricantis]